MRLDAIAASDLKCSRFELAAELTKLDALFAFLDEVPAEERAVVRVSDGTRMYLWDGTRQMVMDIFLTHGRVALAYADAAPQPYTRK